MDDVRQIFPSLAGKVFSSHMSYMRRYASVDKREYDAMHPVRVGNRALQVASAEWRDERLAHLSAMAGMVHYASRLVYQYDHGGVRWEAAVKLMREWLADLVNEQEMVAVISAVYQRNDSNKPDDSPIIIALKDGHRIVGLEPDLVIRYASESYELPPMVCKDPLGERWGRGSWYQPHSVLSKLQYALEWADAASPYGCRTALGQQMAAANAVFIKGYIQALLTCLPASS